MAASCCQLLVAPMSAANVPRTRPKPGKKTLGRTRVSIIFAGTSKKRYETKNSRTMIEYSFELKLKSFSRPPVLALLSQGQQEQHDHQIRDSPNVRAVQEAEQIQSPSAREDTPV